MVSRRKARHPNRLSGVFIQTASSFALKPVRLMGNSFKIHTRAMGPQSGSRFLTSVKGTFSRRALSTHLHAPYAADRSL